jgi:hypothetical protein
MPSAATPHIIIMKIKNIIQMKNNIEDGCCCAAVLLRIV